MLTLDKFEEASEKVREVTLETKLIYSNFLSRQTGNKIYLKPENMQFTGAYKVRGAYYKISTLSEEERARGLITASAGNHAQGVAYLLECGDVDLLGKLHVAEISRRQVGHDERHLRRQGLQAVALGADEFEYVGILLVGHDARPRGEGVGQLHEPEVGARVEAHVLRQTAQRRGHGGDGRQHGAFGLAALHLCVDRVVGQIVEA